MRFMVSLINDGTVMQRATSEERQQFGMRMGQYMSELRESGSLADPGAPLGPSADARTVRHREGSEPEVTDGPFAETKEQIAGYMVLECEDLDEAVDWARRMPVLGGAVEVREIADYDR